MFGLSCSADVYYPHALYNEYKNLPVQCGSVIYSVSVNNYRNLKHGLKTALQLTVHQGQVGGECNIVSVGLY